MIDSDEERYSMQSQRAYHIGIYIRRMWNSKRNRCRRSFEHRKAVKCSWLHCIFNVHHVLLSNLQHPAFYVNTRGTSWLVRGEKCSLETGVLSQKFCKGRLGTMEVLQLTQVQGLTSQMAVEIDKIANHVSRHGVFKSCSKIQDFSLCSIEVPKGTSIGAWIDHARPIVTVRCQVLTVEEGKSDDFTVSDIHVPMLVIEEEYYGWAWTGSCTDLSSVAKNTYVQLKIAVKYMGTKYEFRLNAWWRWWGGLGRIFANVFMKRRFDLP